MSPEEKEQFIVQVAGARSVWDSFRKQDAEDDAWSVLTTVMALRLAQAEDRAEVLALLLDDLIEDIKDIDQLRDEGILTPE